MHEIFLKPVLCFLSFFALGGCYTVTQGYYQTKLIFKRELIDKVLLAAQEKPERLKKLRAVPVVLDFARNRLGLVTGKSYQHYVALEESSVTYTVQAAEKRELKYKTWWFPIVGSQPYLGYFKRDSAVKFRDQMKAEGYDTTLGGVQAFSLLGYFPDPVYSSMLDGNELTDLVEVLIHENVHRTLYIPNFYAFNENLADFVAKKATVLFFKEHPNYGQNIEKYIEKFQKNLKAQELFKVFLIRARNDLQNFYKDAKGNPDLSSDTAFLSERNKIFDALADAYLNHMAGAEKDTGYAWAFRKGNFNNASVLGYSLYEAKQGPFDIALQAADNDLRTFMTNMAVCLKGELNTEDALWQKVAECKG